MSNPHGSEAPITIRGWSPRRQLGGEEFKPHQRLVTYSFVGEFDADTTRGLKVAGDDQAAQNKHHGPDVCWGAWPNAEPEKEGAVAFFSAHFPAVVAAAGDPRGTTAPGMLPIYARDMPDDRQEAKRPRPAVTLPHGSQRFHTGQTGSVTAGTSEEEQVDIFGADWMGILLAVGDPNGDKSLSAYVYDAGPNGGPHSTRYSPIHRLIVPIDTPWGTAPALELTTGPRGDSSTTALPLVDQQANTIGLASFVFGGGPLLASSPPAGHPCTTHAHGVDDLGRPVSPAHLAGGANRGALWNAGPGRDAPLRFDPDPWRPLGSTESGSIFGDPAFSGVYQRQGATDRVGASALWVETFLRYDGESSHVYQRPDGTWGAAPGMFRWQTPVPLITLSAPGFEFSDPVVTEGTVTRGGSSGSSSSSSGGGGGGSGGSGGAGAGGAPAPVPTPKPTAEDYQEAERERQRRRRQGGGGGAAPGQWPPPGQPPQWPPAGGPGPKGGAKPQNGGRPRDPEDSAEGAIGDAEATAGEIAGGPGADELSIYDESQLSPPIPAGDIDLSLFGVAGSGVGGAVLGGQFGGVAAGGGGTLPEGEEPGTPSPTGSTTRPGELTFAETCLQVPNLGWVSYPTADGAIAIGGGGVTQEDLLDAFTNSPLAAYTQAVGIGDGSVGGQTTTTNGDGWLHSTESAVALLPSAAGWRDFLSGAWDAIRDAGAAPATVRLVIPGGLASTDYSHARSDPGFVTAGGGRIREADDGDGIVIVPLDDEGNEVTAYAVELKGDGTFEFGGAQLSTTSGSGSDGIGGSGEDGAVTVGADTSYTAAKNATSFTLSAGFTLYPALNECLVVKSTGAATINGTCSLDGRGYLEPA